MQANEVREKYLKFFEKKGHKIMPPAPLVLKDDPTTLFTSSGMQPLVPYLMGKKHTDGNRLVDSQPSIRVQDIEDVGDNRHTTFFEMLGNWSLGDYFKKDQLSWLWEFLTEELQLPKDKLYVSIFEGNDQVPEDKESYEIWKKLGVAEDHIFKYGVKKNWWSRAGTPDQMPVGEIGGPDSEVFFEFSNVKHNKKYGEKCHPNCDCGRFLEIGNSVFMQFKKTDKGLEELPNKNVDFGGGLERLTAATENDPDVFKTDLFWPIISEIEKLTNEKYEGNEISMRIITDHIKASTFLIASDIAPSNKLQGYVLRRLLRRAAVKILDLTGDVDGKSLGQISRKVFGIYGDVYLNNMSSPDAVQKTISEEVDKFSKNIQNGIKKIEKTDPSDIDEKFAFDLMQSEGFPFEITKELAEGKGVKIDKNKFDDLVRHHQELSRKSSEDKFKIK
ncbi:MAG TPA: alanine--tRNA ligase-related protein [Candidatus Saccharimonadales bacterium]|nr:alanine--tRNA ligase-related protein [Candidatus Saccharimonadales bacterium]